MNESIEPASWIWHPHWEDFPRDNSAGGFVHFRKSLTLDGVPSPAFRLRITADTRYKLYINGLCVADGPVKGDRHLWFYDEIDVSPHLRTGDNHVAVRVLRFYHATPFAISFPRLPCPGLIIQAVEDDSEAPHGLQSNASWETAIDTSTRLPTNIAEDEFLHIYEAVDNTHDSLLSWIPARELSFPSSHGLSAPWNLSPRTTPRPEVKPATFKDLHNVSSPVETSLWSNLLLDQKGSEAGRPIRLRAGSSHHLELECSHHITAWLTFRFNRPAIAGSKLHITYSECYEDEPEQVPYLRRKGDRRDTTRKLIGPSDEYVFGGLQAQNYLGYYQQETSEERFSPFHFRTFRFLAVDIEVGPSADLEILGIDAFETHYPLEVRSEFDVDLGSDDLESKNGYRMLYQTSIRTLENCMHDCYEDCPFYEQLQYAMDVRSSALFTYTVSGDDRLARQAIRQLHNSFDASIGLTASRAPAHQAQFIPHFSLFWVCMVADHFTYFRDARFVRRFLAVCDAVFDTFAARLDPELGLIRVLDRETAARQWDFVDWTESWRPMGIPPAATRTGFQTFTNSLYAYTLKQLASLQQALGRPGVAEEYCARADAVVERIKKHCYDGSFFTDGLFQPGDSYSHEDLSQTNQIWAVLSGAASGQEAQQILRGCLINKSASDTFAPASTAMSFYAFRALSLVGSTLYSDHFHQSWDPWRKQLALGMTTWLEDTVSQRSDCHAWGSAPLYELLAEVVGVRPLAGKLEIGTWTFAPRLELFPTLLAKVPLVSDSQIADLHVEWKPVADDVKITIVLENDSSHQMSDVRLQVALPGQEKYVAEVLAGEPVKILVAANFVNQTST